MLRRKVRVTKIIAVVEVVSYLCLLVPMYRKHILNDDSTRNYLYLRMVAYFHGIICVAFAVMVIDIHRCSAGPSGSSWRRSPGRSAPSSRTCACDATRCPRARRSPTSSSSADQLQDGLHLVLLSRGSRSP